MSELSHYDDRGNIRMVDISSKDVSARRAVASGRVFLSTDTIAILKKKESPKGDPLEIARIAGIQAAKRTAELIPLCHQIALSSVDIKIELDNSGIDIEATVRTSSQTGVEMEALTAVSVAALTIYDMCKAVQKDIVISSIQLESKSGGKTDYVRK